LQHGLNARSGTTAKLVKAGMIGTFQPESGRISRLIKSINRERLT
jgi:hypothetical protein